MQEAAVRCTFHALGITLLAGGAGVLAIGMIAMGAIVGSEKSAEARPAFSSQTGFGCNRCHTAPPQLNSYGKAFKAAGNQVPKKKK